MSPSATIPIASRATARRFAARLGLFYGSVFGLIGTHTPFFPVWLRSVGIDAPWIGVINAVPSVTRFAVLPFLTGLAERHQALRGAMIVAAFATALGFSVLGMLHQRLAVLIVFALTACVWTPLVPLADGYALKGVVHYGLNYGPLRLWGSAAFVLGAMACGLLVDVIAATNLIWVIAAMATVGAAVSLGLQPLAAAEVTSKSLPGAACLLREPGFLAVMATAALIQASHAAYYSFASITWQAAGLGGPTIAALWVLGVLAEIVVFALSPRFRWPPALLVVAAGLCATARWLITAQEPPLAMLTMVQMLHGMSYGMTQVGTMAILVRRVPSHVMATAQGYLTACLGVVMSSATVLSGVIYARHGREVYYAMAAMALIGALVMWLARYRADAPYCLVRADQPHSAESGG